MTPVRASHVLTVLGLVALVGIGGGLGAHRYLPQAPTVRGLYIGERRAPDRGVSAWLVDRREAARSRTVRFRHQDRFFETTLDAAGVTLDVAATIAAAEVVGPPRLVFADSTSRSSAPRAGRGAAGLVGGRGQGPSALATFAASLARARSTLGSI